MATTPWHLFRSNLEVYSQTWTQNLGGTPNATAGATLTHTVRCWMQPTSASDALVYGRDTTTEVWDVFCAPTNTSGAAWDCAPKDRILIDGTRYRALGKPRDMVSLDVVKVMTVERDTN
jgi:hypothetical protein